MKRLIAIPFLMALLVASAKDPEIAPSHAWQVTGPLGLRESVDLDTTFVDYSLRSIPSAVSPAYATTGNLGAEGRNLIYFERESYTDFFFEDALRAWLPSIGNMRFYNTRIPMTLLSYNFGGGKENAQDHLNAIFSGNINSKAQVGALIDYIYSKGSYNYQATKDLTWGFSGSYIGDRFEFQGYYNHYNFVNKENGGITDDLYITDPAEIQGGATNVDYKTIPTRLSGAHNRIVGGELMLNSRYKLGFWRDVPDGDTVRAEYVPVTSFVWTLGFNNARHTFRNTNATQGREFWPASYLSANGTNDQASYWCLSNTFGVSLLEGFNKYAKAGLSVYIRHHLHRFKQPQDTLNRTVPLPASLTPLPEGVYPAAETQNKVYVGAQLIRRQGKILNYQATGEFGILGSGVGEVSIDGEINTHIPLFGDTVSLTAYGMFTNLGSPYFMDHYISNHFAWDNSFSMERRLRFGGEFELPFSGTNINVGVENVQNHLYFDADALPAQYGGSIQVFSATLKQNFRLGILNWQNSITYQTSTNDEVLPLPKLAINSNLYILFSIAHAMKVQFGVNCDYYTKYKALAYQPATMVFYNQREVDCGNYPFMSVYVNMKLSRARFYVMFSHVNQGLIGGNNFFSLPHYPLNPRRLQLGISVDFAN